MRNLDTVEFVDGISVRTMDVPPQETGYLLKSEGWTKRMADQAHWVFRPEDFAAITFVSRDDPDELDTLGY